MTTNPLKFLQALCACALLGSVPAVAQQSEQAQQSEEAQQAELDRARQRLEEAAHEVAELSSQLADGKHREVVRVITAGPRRAVIGVQLDPASGTEGVRIADVSPGGPAQTAGLRAGDLITRIDSLELRGNGEPGRLLIERMATVEPGQKLRIAALRDGKPIEATVVARAAPPPFEMPLIGMVGSMDGAPEEFSNVSVSGMELASLTPGLGRYFGTDKGVLVLRAPRSSVWQLEDGDVVLAIDGREPTSGGHATRIFRSYQAGEKVSMRVLRQRKPLTLSVTVPEGDMPRHRMRMAPMPPMPPMSPMAPMPLPAPAAPKPRAPG
jgi:type II secretory pathway component PulC